MQESYPPVRAPVAGRDVSFPVLPPCQPRIQRKVPRCSAGAIAGATLNGLSLLFLSLLRAPHREDTTITTGRRGKRVGHDHDERTTGPAMV